MDINCKKCAQKYHIPDDQITSRRIYFNCEKCGYKIILDLRGENWSAYKGLSSERLSSRDIIEGIFYSFNMKNIFVTFLIMLAYIFFFTILYLVISRNGDFLVSHPVLAGMTLFFLALVMTYLFDVHLYLISKNVYNRIKNGRNLQFSSISPEIFDDMKPIFIISAGILLVFALIFFPALLMQDYYAFIYEGIFHSANLVLLFLIIGIFFTKNFLYAFIALRNRSFKDTFGGIFRFMAIENINIPLYLFLSWTVTGFIFAVIQSLILMAFFIIFSLMAPLASVKAGGGILPMMLDGRILKIFSEGAGSLGPVMDGISLVAVSTAVVFLFILSYVVTLNQSISSVAVHIMESNPGRSMDRRAILSVLGFMAAAGIFMIFMKI